MSVLAELSSQMTKGGGTVAYMWLVWDKGHIGAPEVRWLNLDHKNMG